MQRDSMELKRVKDFYIKGTHFGYPICCIKEFTFTFFDPNRVARKFYGTGFVPCQECNDNKTYKELIKEIEANRKHPEPFQASIKKAIKLKKVFRERKWINNKKQKVNLG